MTAATEPGQRIDTLDILRGIGVMGILAMNIVAFSMPFQAYMNPLAYGGATGADLWAWVTSFIFVDGRMRAMFSLLFGASMLLVLHSAALSGESPAKVHTRRMLWLLAFGLAHFFLIWFGDILTSYALVGLVAYGFARKKPPQLMRWSLVFFALGLVMAALAFLFPLAMQAVAEAPGADANLVSQWQAVEREILPTPQMIEQDLAIYRGSYLDVIRHAATDRSANIPSGLLVFGPETLALMLLGMWGLKSGFLEGKWETSRYRNVALVCLGFTIPAYATLAWATVSANFSLQAIMFYAGFLPALIRPIMTIGYVALIILVIKSTREGAIRARIAAAGRAAFTNYLGTSIVATFIFYGWGLGLYGTLGRAEVYLIVLALWAVMLLWSKPWLERYRYGPLEWLWRSLARGTAQPMRRALPAAQPA